MEKNEGWIKVEGVRILWVVMAVLLCAVPCSAIDVEDEQTLEVTSNIYEYEFVTVKSGGTLIVKPGAVIFAVAAQAGSIVDIYGGIITYGIEVSPDTPNPVITVYGTGFEDSSGLISADQWDPTGSGGNVLTVTYTDENGDPIGDPVNLLFYSDIPINLVDTTGGPEPEPISVQIDIKPGSDPNPINQGSNGVIPVAILTTDSFDASTVDPGTVTLNGADVAVRGKSEKLMARLEDIDGDGDDDLLLQVETQSDDALWESGTVTLLGKTYDGQDIMGTDVVIIVPPE